MKKIAITAAAAMFLLIVSFRPAPHEAGAPSMGLYLTPDDFQHSKLSYAEPVAGAVHTIKIHDGLFGSSTVDLIYNGKKEVFSLDRVYGYRDAKGQDFRFFEREAYRIADTAGFYLYSCVKLVQGQKIARPQTLYYFSVRPDDHLQALTLGNLETAYAGNARFRYGLEALEGQFRGDVELTAYDGALGTYKIKYLYAQSLQ